jgi:putative ABC transport system permease protein
MGRGFAEEEYRQQAPVAVISHELWVRRFAADSGVIGRSIEAHSTDRPDAPPNVTIVGVMPRGFWPIHWRQSDLLRPYPRDNSMPILVRLLPGATRAEVESRFDGIVRAQISGEIDPSWHMSLISALERHSLRARPMLGAVFGAALFTLLAACASVAGALVTRMAARRNELGVRMAMGGSRARILRQLLTESAVLAMIAGILGVAVAYVLLDVTGPAIMRLIGTATPGGVAALRPTAGVMLRALLVSLLAGAALGLLPALAALRMQAESAAARAMISSSRGSARQSVANLRRFLIAGQVTAATVLLFGAGLMVRTVARMAETDVGLRDKGVLTGSTLLPEATYPDSAAKRELMSRLLARITETPGVRSAAAVYPLPFQGFGYPVSTEGSAADAESGPAAGVYTVTPAYFETMDIRLLAGRTFRDGDDHTGPLVVMISEALAREIAPAGDAIGRRIRVRVPYLASFDDQDAMPWRTVIGIVTDTRTSFSPDGGPDIPDVPDVYVPYAQNPRSRQSLVVRTDGAEESAREPVLRAVAAVDPLLVFDNIAPISQLIAQHGTQRRGLMVLLSALAVFVLGLSAIALYASLACTVIQRRAELAVRIAVGASTRSILRLVVAEGAITAAAGIAAGVAASLALGRVLRNQLYGVASTDPGTLITICVVLALAVLAACLSPGLRATRTDPALALRE